MSLTQYVETESADAAEPPAQAHLCAECGCESVPGERWKCPVCDATMRYGYRHAPCPHCGRDAFWDRKRNNYRCHCRCRETPEQRAVRLEDEAQRNRRERREIEEEERRSGLAYARKETQALMDGARNCWENEKRRQCSVSMSQVNETGGPRDFCRVCPKFIKQADKKK